MKCELFLCRMPSFQLFLLLCGIQIGNRIEDEKLLDDTLYNHGFSEIRKNNKDCWACVAKMKSSGANEIAQKAKELMRKFQ